VAYGTKDLSILLLSLWNHSANSNLYGRQCPGNRLSHQPIIPSCGFTIRSDAFCCSNVSVILVDERDR
jgi:hypothetical protein